MEVVEIEENGNNSYTVYFENERVYTVYAPNVSTAVERAFRASLGA